MFDVTEYLKEFGHFQRDARLFLINTVLGGVSVGIILVLYNLYLQSLGYRTVFIGLILFVGAIGDGLVIFRAGVCMDRFGGKVILIWTTVLLGIAGVGQILLPMPIPLLVSTFVAGIGAAFILVVNAPFLTAHSTPVERPELFSLNMVLTLVTTVLGEILGGALPLWLRSIPWLMTSLPPWCAWVLVHNSEPRSYQLALLFSVVISIPSFIPLLLMQDDRPETEQTTSVRPLSRLPNLVTHTMSLAVTAWKQRISIRTTFGSPRLPRVAVQ